MVQRISSLDTGYVSGDLSVYPEAKDDVTTLYQAKNLAQTTLRQSLTYSGKYLIVESTAAFPDKGLIRVGPKSGPGSAELIYYDKKTASTFLNLVRGFPGSRQNQWPVGSYVTAGVMAEHHNAVKDAILQIQKNLGVEEFPEDESLNDILKELEVRFLAPKPLFRAYPTKGAPPLRVRFQNFSTGTPLRFLWDFGDGSTSAEKSPIHTFRSEGLFTVKLNMISGLGAQGIATKFNYIKVSEEEKQPFVYVSPIQGDSIEKAAAKTAAGTPTDPTTFHFVDQTDGDISQRYWIFGDGQSLSVEDPNVHTATHVYTKAGLYEPSLLILFPTQAQRRIFISDKITVF